MPIETDTPNNSTPSERNLSGPWPWYVLLSTGFAISGLLPWLMVSHAIYQRKHLRAALLTAGINLLVFAAFAWGLLTLPLHWQALLTGTYLFNLLWALSAWGFQRYAIGPAARRYIWREWRSWLTPAAIGVLLGLGLSVLFAVTPALQQRVALAQSGETLARESLLWDFFAYLPYGAMIGLLIGFWWAGERTRFRTSHILTFLSALTLTMIFWSVLGLLLLFLVHKGTLAGVWEFRTDDWAVIPSWVQGWGKFLLKLEMLDVSAVLVTPLLFGVVSRIRDFGRRSLLIPLAFFCLFPRVFSENTWWTTVQDQIFYEMSAPQPAARAAAYRWGSLLLKRYPDHLQWPQIAAAVAQYDYEHGKYDQARAVYQKLVDRYSGLNQWQGLVTLARDALAMPDFGESPSGPMLAMPVVDYEDYLSPEWMALLAVIRYWESEQVSETELKMRLKDFSLREDRIELGDLENLVDIDDAARHLGYEVLLLAADASRFKNLIAAGFPILYQRQQMLTVLWGFEESRAVVSEYRFDYLTSRLQREAPQASREIMEYEAEGQGKSQERRLRIAQEAYYEHPLSLWETPALRYSGPVLALVFPGDMTESLAAVLGTSAAHLQQESQGYLATLIGLAYLENTDPVQAISWARVGADKTTDPLPLYVAHLARMLWDSRTHSVKSTLPLQNQFPELNEVFTFFQDPETTAFLERAQQQFTQDLNDAVIPWNILHGLLNQLDWSNPADAALMEQILRKAVTLDAERYDDWSKLANLYEWLGNTTAMVDALQGLVSAYANDQDAKLRLAYGQVLLERYADAQTTLATLDGGEVAYNADYAFCRAAIAEFEGKRKQALELYAQAIDMRPYKPMYHLKYGKLLLQEGRTDDARKALTWAAEIDAGGQIKHDAESLLGQIGQ